MNNARLKKKYLFTLLEVLIACMLAGILMAFLFTYFRQTLVRKQQLHIVKEKVMQIELVRLRLTHLFDCIAQDKGKVLCVSHEEADGKGLLLYATQGIDPQVDYNGPSYAMLYKTQDKRLALCRWDKDKKQKRVDTLLKKVNTLSFSFFSDGKWGAKWPKKKDASSAPLMVKMTLSLQDNNELKQEFIFSCCTPQALCVEKKL